MDYKNSCKHLNTANYCEKKKQYISVPQDCNNCENLEKIDINENLHILVD